MTQEVKLIWRKNSKLLGSIPDCIISIDGYTGERYSVSRFKDIHGSRSNGGKYSPSLQPDSQGDYTDMWRHLGDDHEVSIDQISVDTHKLQDAIDGRRLMDNLGYDDPSERNGRPLCEVLGVNEINNQE